MCLKYFSTFIACFQFCSVAQSKVWLSLNANSYIWSSNETWLFQYKSLSEMNWETIRTHGSIPKDAQFRVYFLPRNKGKLNVDIRISSFAKKNCTQLTGKLYEAKSKKMVGKVKASCRSGSTTTLKAFEVSPNEYFYLKIKSKGWNVLDLYRFITSIYLDGPGSISLEASGQTMKGRDTKRSESIRWRYEYPLANYVSYYNEMMIPEECDHGKTYYAAQVQNTAFYFGLQNNGEKEWKKSLVFSVWASDHIQDPSKLPQNLQVLMLSSGNGTTTQDFGSEGSGKQSFMKYNWTPNTWYQLLTTAYSDGNHTIYTGYFKDPASSAFKLIASFRKPGTNGLSQQKIYSFVEHYSQEHTGYLKRCSRLRNAWVKAENGLWSPITTGYVSHSMDTNQRYDFNGNYILDGVVEISTGGFDHVVNLKDGSLYRMKTTSAQDQLPIEVIDLKISS